MKISRRHAVVAASLIAATFTGTALAQGWPTKTVTIVVSYPAGGDTDVMARMFAEKLTKRLGQSVIVDNKPGASGTIGSAHVAKAAPDGYTLLMAPNTFAMAQFVLKTGSGSSYDVLGGFTPIVQTSTQPLFLASNPASGIKDFKTLLAQARRESVAYASPGSGSPMHVLGEMFNKAAGTKMTQVPYKGVAPAVNDLVGGHVPTTFLTYGPLEPYLGGKVTLLAVAQEKRSTLAPDVPTLQEQGIHGSDVSAWQGLYGPKGLPQDIVALLNRHMNEILKEPDVVKRMATFGALPEGGDPAHLAQTTATDYNRFGKIIKDLGIQAE